MTAAVEARARVPPPFSQPSIDTALLERLVQEELQNRLEAMSLELVRELGVASDDSFRQTWTEVWRNLSPALAMCDAVAKNTYSMAPL
jgi:hypothetical protein